MRKENELYEQTKRGDGAQKETDRQTLEGPETFGQQLRSRTQLNWPTCRSDPITNIAI